MFVFPATILDSKGREMPKEHKVEQPIIIELPDGNIPVKELSDGPPNADEVINCLRNLKI